MNLNASLDQVKVPLYGCDCYAYALLATGFVDLVIESGLKVTVDYFMKLIPDFGVISTNYTSLHFITCEMFHHLCSMSFNHHSHLTLMRSQQIIFSLTIFFHSSR